MSETVILTALDISPWLTTKDQAASLALAVQTAKQIIVRDDTIFPTFDQLQHLTYGDVEVLQNLWNVAHAHQPAITWNAFLELLEPLIEEMSQAVVTIKIPYQPLMSQVTDLLQIVRKQFSPLALLEVMYQPDLTAGCILQFNGQQFNYSLETWWSKFLPASPTLGTNIQ